MSDDPPSLPAPLVRAAVEAALAEDLGLAGDVTSAATITAAARAESHIGARRGGVVAGMALARAAFAAVDPDTSFDAAVADGDHVSEGSVLARIAGPARSVLSAERVALNFLTHLSGIATATRAFADRVAHTRARITCTRKMTPGLRAFEKYAVRCGGGSNHRFGLFDAVLIKDNHIAVSGGVRAALEAARRNVGHMVKIEIEVGTLDELRQALDGHPDVVMLDNMSPATLREAVGIAGGRVVLEASGAITLGNVAEVAETGVDYISSGWITHSAPALDLGLDVAELI